MFTTAAATTLKTSVLGLGQVVEMPSWQSLAGICLRGAAEDHDQEVLPLALQSEHVGPWKAA